MVYDKIWSAAYIKNNPGEFKPKHFTEWDDYESDSDLAIKELSKNKTDSLSSFVDNIYGRLVLGMEKGRDHGNVILHNYADAGVMGFLHTSLQSKINDGGLDCLVFTAPNNHRDIEDLEENYLVDVGRFVDNGWLGDLEERTSISRRTA